MTLEIWVLESDIKRLKELSITWLSSKNEKTEPIRYYTYKPTHTRGWICINISLDEYYILTDNDLIIKL